VVHTSVCTNSSTFLYKASYCGLNGGYLELPRKYDLAVWDTVSQQGLRNKAVDLCSFWMACIFLRRSGGARSTYSSMFEIYPCLRGRGQEKKQL